MKEKIFDAASGDLFSELSKPKVTAKNEKPYDPLQADLPVEHFPVEKFLSGYSDSDRELRQRLILGEIKSLDEFKPFLEEIGAYQGRLDYLHQEMAFLSYEENTRKPNYAIMMSPSEKELPQYIDSARLFLSYSSYREKTAREEAIKKFELKKEAELKKHQEEKLLKKEKNNNESTPYEDLCPGAHHDRKRN